MGGIGILVIMLIAMAFAVFLAVIAICLIGVALTGIIGGIALLITGKALDKSQKKKTWSKICIVASIVLLCVGIASSGAIVAFVTKFM